MGKFGELTKYLKPEHEMTVKGKTYVLPLVDGNLGVWCRLLASMTGELHAASTDEEMQAVVDRINDLPELPGNKDVSLAQRMLGPVYQEMLADGVEDPYIEFCGVTAYIAVIVGEQKAEQYWNSGGNLPEASSPANRETRRAASRGRTSTAAASGTRTPASTSGTRSRTTSSANAPAKAASRGKKS